VAKGTRRCVGHAAPAEVAEALYERVCEGLEQDGGRVGRGVSRARMAVALVNDGPVTPVVDI
jgi:D-Tyr-tRNAtyr deacylase